MASFRRAAVVLVDDRFDRGDGPEPACAWSRPNASSAARRASGELAGLLTPPPLLCQERRHGGSSQSWLPDRTKGSRLGTGLPRPARDCSVSTKGSRPGTDPPRPARDCAVSGHENPSRRNFRPARVVAGTGHRGFLCGERSWARRFGRWPSRPGVSVAAPATCPGALRARIGLCRSPTRSPFANA